MTCKCILTKKRQRGGLSARLSVSRWASRALRGSTAPRSALDTPPLPPPSPSTPTLPAQPRATQLQPHTRRCWALWNPHHPPSPHPLTPPLPATVSASLRSLTGFTPLCSHWSSLSVFPRRGCTRDCAIDTHFTLCSWKVSLSLPPLALSVLLSGCALVI